MDNVENEEYVICPRCEQEVYKEAILCPFCKFGIMAWLEGEIDEFDKWFGKAAFGNTNLKREISFVLLLFVLMS